MTDKEKSVFRSEMRSLQDFSEDDEIEISDLDTPDERLRYSPVYHLLKRARETHLSPRTRTILFVLALLIGGSVLAYQFIPPPHPKTTSFTYTVIQTMSTMSITPVSPAINISVTNGIAYIFTENGTLSPQRANDGTLSSQRANDGTLNAQRASDGKFLWRTKVSLSSSSPIIADNTIFLTSQNSKGGHVDALRTSDGTLAWSFQTPSLASPEPLMVKDAVAYVLTHNGTIYALNANNGHLLWQFATRLSIPLSNLLYSSNGVTAVLSTIKTAYLLRTQDGSPLWHYTFDNYNTPWTPDIEEGIVYIHSNENVLQARRLSDGKLLWQYTASRGDAWTFTVQNSVFYVNTGNDTLKALNELDGTTIWNFKMNDGIRDWHLKNGLIFLTSLNGYFEALRALDGSLLWKFKASPYTNIFWFSDTSSGLLHIIVDQPDFALYTLRINDGRVLWRQALNNLDKNHLPDISDTALYTWQSDGSIDAWRSNDGHHLWHYQPSIPINQETIVDGLIYMQQEDGTINVLRAQDGKIAWSYPSLANP